MPNQFFRCLLSCCCCLRASPGDADFAEANKALNKPDAPTNPTHLMKAIASYTKAIDAWDPNQANYSTAHVNRGLARLWLCELNEKPDAETLKKIISDNHTALNTWQQTNTESEAYFQACYSLGTAYRLRLPITKDLKDGRNAIKYHEKALHVAGNMRTNVLIELGTSRWEFSERAKTDEELDGAIKNLKEALTLCEVDVNSQARCVHSLAGAYNVRYALTKGSHDLKTAVTFYQQASKSPHLKSGDKPAAFLQLSRSLAIQNEHGDLEAAISEVGNCLNLIGDNNIQHPLYADAQDHLGDLYWLRYSNATASSQGLDDLSRAIDAYHAALRSRRSPSTLFNIAAVHFTHFQESRDKEKLLGAKTYAEEAQKLPSTEHLSKNIQELLEDIAVASTGRTPKRTATYKSTASQE